MTTFFVTNTNNFGAGSLRQAILDANAAAGADAIEFDRGLSGQSIGLSAPLAITGDVTINGLGRDQLTIDGNGEDIFRVNVNAIAVTLAGVTLTDGGEGVQVDGSSNAITLLNSRIADARVLIDASGLEVRDDGLRVEGSRNNLTVINSIFERNEDNIEIVGSNNILDIANSTSRFAGQDGIAVGGNANAVTIRNSTVNENGLRPVNDVNDGIDFNGSDNVVTLQQVTISGNGEHGLDIEGARNLVSVEHSTIVRNGSDGLILQDRFTSTSIMFVENSIVAENRGELSSRSDVFNFAGTFVSGGHNLIGNGRGAATAFDGPGDQVGTPAAPINPRLGPLQDNGGPTLTHGLLAGSPALNAGDPLFTSPPEFDQRGPGFSRVRDDTLDIGAFEVNKPQFNVRLESVRVIEAGEDRIFNAGLLDDDFLTTDAEWRLDFFANSGRILQLSDDSVRDGDVLRISRDVRIDAPGPPAAPTLTLETSGFEDDGLFLFDDALPSTRIDITPAGPGESASHFSVSGENDAFAYVVNWEVQFLGGSDFLG